MVKSDEEPNRAAMPQCRERQSNGLSLSLRGDRHFTQFFYTRL